MSPLSVTVSKRKCHVAQEAPFKKARMGCCVVLASGREAQQAETRARGLQRRGLYPVCFSDMQGIVTCRAPAVQFLQLLIL